MEVCSRAAEEGAFVQTVAAAHQLFTSCQTVIVPLRPHGLQCIVLSFFDLNVYGAICLIPDVLSPTPLWGCQHRHSISLHFSYGKPLAVARGPACTRQPEVQP